MEESSSHYRWWVLLASTVTQLAAALASQGIGVWGAFAQRQFILSNTQLGLLAGVANAMPVLGLVIVGPVLDRQGERGIVFAGMMVLTAALLTLGMADGVMGLFIAMALIGIGYTPIQPGGSKAIYHWFPANQRGLAMGIRQAALPLGGALAASVLPPLLLYDGWRPAMCVAAMLIAVGGLFFVLIYRNPSVPSLATRQQEPPWHGLLSHLSQHHFRSIAILGATLVSTQTAIAVFWALYLTHQFRMSLPLATGQLLLLQAAGALGRVVLSSISDHLVGGRRSVVYACAGCVAVGLAIAASLGDGCPAWCITALSISVGFFCFGWYGPWVVWLSESADRHQVGEVLGVAMSLNQIAITATPILFGYTVDRTVSFATPWATFALLLASTLTWHQWRAATDARTLR